MIAIVASTQLHSLVQLKNFMDYGLEIFIEMNDTRDRCNLRCRKITRDLSNYI